LERHATIHGTAFIASQLAPLQTVAKWGDHGTRRAVRLAGSAPARGDSPYVELSDRPVGGIVSESADEI
jgi:hypothetical protein